MKRILLAAAILASLPASASAATLAIAVFDNGALVGSTTAVDGTASLNITSDPAFDVLDINAAGAPFIPHADLSSVSLSVTSAAITGLHTLVVDIFQGGVSLPPFLTKSTFSVNNLIGVPGAATLSTFVNGTGILDLGTALASHVFPLGTITDTAEADTLAPALFADAQQYKIAFFAPDPKCPSACWEFSVDASVATHQRASLRVTEKTVVLNLCSCPRHSDSCSYPCSCSRSYSSSTCSVVAAVSAASANFAISSRVNRNTVHSCIGVAPSAR